MVISTDTEKEFGKIQHLFMTNILKEVGKEQNSLNLVKGIYEKPKLILYVKWWRAQCFSNNIRNKTRMSTLTTSVHHCPGGSNENNRARKQNNSHSNRKERCNLFTANNMVLEEILRNPLKTTRINKQV